jgi:hypothetical protein
MLDQRSLPNFFIIGAPKAGTTTLFNIISKFPEVYSATQKEIRFFTKDVNYRKGLAWYQQTYFNGAADYPIRMEATPTYLTWSEKSSRRLDEDYPTHELKFAVIFRDPVQRAYSHYWHRFRQDHEDLTFEEAIKAEPDRMAKHYDELFSNGYGRYTYFRAGCYASRLQPFLDRFKKEQFIFLITEDLLPDAYPVTITRIKEFLEISGDQTPSIKKDNPATSLRWDWMKSPYSRLKHSFLGKFYLSIINEPLRNKIQNRMYTATANPPMNPDFASQLRARYFEEIKALERIIERDLSKWMEP